MLFLLGWFFGSLIVGAIGTDRTVGFLGGFLFSLILSPLVGLIIVLVSKDKAVELREKQGLAIQKAQLSAMQERKTPQQTLTEKLAELEVLKNNDTITLDEYNLRRGRLIAAID